MNRNSPLKAIGYLISTVSVLLIGVVAWDSAKDDRLLRLCLIAGMASSIIGMGLRWWSHRREQRQEGKA